MLFKTRCKMWSCKDCAKINADLWTMRVTSGAHQLMASGHDCHLVTVTAHERHSVARAVEVLPHAWNKLRCQWQRSGEKPEYCLIPEVGKKGHFHVHLITTGARGTRWWKDTARTCGFGFSNDESERFLSASKAGFYAGKYLAKQLNNNIWKKGFHRVRTSRGWPKMPPLPPPENWTFRPIPKGSSIPSLVSYLHSQSYSVVVSDEKASWELIKSGELTGGSAWLTMLTPLTLH